MLLLQFILCITWIHVSLQQDLRDYCLSEAFQPECSTNEVILMETALFGRMSLGRCLSRDYGVGCYADVTMILDGYCSGLRNCSVDVSDSLLSETEPCPKDLNVYLTAQYRCVTASNPASERCNPGESKVITPVNGGYLTSTAVNELDHYFCSWLIRAADGQRLNISLYDFEASKNKDPNPNYCYKYAVLRDTQEGQREIVVCADTEGRRVRAVMYSSGSQVEVRMVTGTRKPNFMLKYEVTGCPTLQLPERLLVKRRGDTILVQCNTTGESWYLECRNNRWIGQLGNCPRSDSSEDDIDSSEETKSCLPPVPTAPPSDISWYMDGETNDVHLSWGEIPEDYRNGDIIKYGVVYHKINTHLDVQHIISTEREVTIQSLDNEVEYIFQIQGFNKYGPGPWSYAQSFIIGPGT